MTQYIHYPTAGGSGSGVQTYANFAAFPVSAADGTLAIALDTDTLYIYNGAAWQVLASPSSANAITALTGDVTATGPGSVAATIAAGAVTTAKIANLTIVNGNISASAAIARSKTASGTAYRILANDVSGVMSENAAITASRAVVSDTNGQLVAATTTATEIGFVNGVTSAIQTQLNAKGVGSVTSVALSVPASSIFGVSGSPVTTTGTLGLTVTGTSGGIPYFDTTSTLSTSGALTASRLVLGGGAGAAPTVLGSLGTTTTVLHGNAAGAPTFGAVSLTADVSGVLPLANGGTNANITAANGQVAYSTASALALTTSGSTGQILQRNTSAAPTWSTPTYPSASGTTGKMLRSNGTNNVYSTSTWPDTFTTGNILYASGTNAVSGLTNALNSVLTFGTSTAAWVTLGANQVITSDGDSVFAAQLAMSQITGTVAVSQGGTGITSGTSGGIPYYSGSSSIASSTALTAHGVVIGGGAATAPTSTSAGTSGQVLTSNGASADPTFQAAPFATGVAFTGSASSTSVSNGNQTTLASWTEDLDQGSNFNNTTGIFTAPTTGVYAFSAAYSSNAAIVVTGGSAATLLFNKNNGASSWGIIWRAQVTGTYRVDFGGGGPAIALTAGDTVRLDLLNNSGSGLTGENTTTFFSGWKLGN